MYLILNVVWIWLFDRKQMPNGKQNRLLVKWKLNEIIFIEALIVKILLYIILNIREIHLFCGNGGGGKNR